MASVAMLACVLLHNIWVVDDDGGPGVDFTDIPPAIAAAADGDILLVQPGIYSPFTLSGKGLRILGSGSSDTIVQNTGAAVTTTISDIPPKSIAYVDRLRFQLSSPNPDGVLVLIEGSKSEVTLADCVVQGSGSETALRVVGAAAWVFRSTLNASAAGGPPDPPGGGNALEVWSGAFVHVAGSSLQGGSSPLLACPIAAPPGLGAWISGGSEVWFADTDVIGGANSCDYCGPSWMCGTGGTALVVDSSTVRVSGGPTSLIRGGAAGCSGSMVQGGAYFSGAGIVSAGASTVTVHGVTVLPGPCEGGNPTCTTTPCFGSPATIGPGIEMSAPPLPVLEVSGSLTLSGGSATVSLANGPPSALFFVGVAVVPDHVDPGALFLGEFLVDPTVVFPFFSGVLSATGGASLTMPLGGLPPSFAHLPFHFQGIALDPGGTFWRVSSSTVATVRP